MKTMKRGKIIGIIRRAYGYTRREARAFYRLNRCAIRDLAEATKIEHA